MRSDVAAAATPAPSRRSTFSTGANTEQAARATRGSSAAHRACVLLGIVATCRALRIPAQAYLAWAFERLGTHRDVFALPLEDMTPAAFKKTRA